MRRIVRADACAQLHTDDRHPHRWKSLGLAWLPAPCAAAAGGQPRRTWVVAGTPRPDVGVALSRSGRALPDGTLSLTATPPNHTTNQDSRESFDGTSVAVLRLSP